MSASLVPLRPLPARPPVECGYAELHCLSNFSFQRGASSARELFERALRLGYRALAITDECSLAGIVRAWQASRETGLPLIVGSELQVEGGPKLVLLVEDAAGYRDLCRLITRARRRAPKGEYRLLGEDFDDIGAGLLCLWLAGAEPDPAHGRWLRARFPRRTWLAAGLHCQADDAQRIARWQALAAELALPLVASGDVHMHARGRRALQDAMTAIRHRTTVAEAGGLLFPNGERHLRPLPVLATLYPREWREETLRIAGRCIGFDLKKDIDYQYPHELVPAGHDATSWLRELVMRGARERWEKGIPAKAAALIEKELALIATKKYESYFLTVHDIVAYARGQHILCQGRGSAANSAVCYALHITELDPTGHDLLFERFISADRDEPPDIDVDFEHQRREEVIQYVFARYGRERAALAAVATTYGGRGALRDVARVLGLPQDAIGRLTSTIGHWGDELPTGERLREQGFDPESPLMHRIIVLAGELVNFPHYLSQHPGGFVVSERALHTMVPVENAAMDGRTVIQWDKDDLEAMGLLKVDVLALGMLTAVRKAFELIERHHGVDYTLATIPKEDADTYRMIQAADTIGVFQIESRAQMAMLPRLKPEKFYDLVVEVAIVRPGPIQGDMVHPYLRRRTGEEKVTYPSPELKQVLRRTLGVPLFQEQVMQIAMVAAGYDASEADGLRRSMAAWKRHGGLEKHREKLIAGMLERNYPPEFAERIFEQIKGFGSYGFPESHAASFALIAYATSWLKCHHPAEFACALLNSQPMGFYSPDQLLQDARRHGVAVRPLDVRYSGWDCSLEPERGDALAIRLGLRLLRGFGEDAAVRIEQARAQAAFADVADLAGRAGLDAAMRECLADSGALRGLAGHRHRARWAAAGVEPSRPLLAASSAPREAQVALPLPSAGEDMHADYASLGTTLGRHPLALLRRQLRARRCLASNELDGVESGRRILAAGLVTGRQRPQTASGVTFVTLEDEHGLLNVIVRRDLAARQRREFLQSRLLMVEGRLETSGQVRHLLARRLHDLTPLLDGLDVRSRDFR
ncbi:error-prone DNA polymerase [Pseudoxanthomonas suwonensis]|uniref:Error-prone DNA polymerase n=1 Tax=Pseudoxanthomonas suwonensis TaxID=314722 RepID=A0A0E3Z4U7_9GAMM|nr:error-prone DNA polymerase [Pseudoxanthomonas suwonensis]AKC87674.1 DNA polymerase [Pseudoxanthomonas suwonensis]